MPEPSDPDRAAGSGGVAAALRRRPMAGGLIASLALHVIALLLILLGLPSPREAPPEQVMAVDLVQLGDATAAPAASEAARLPQEPAKEVAPPAPADTVPVAATPTPPAVKPQIWERSPPELLTTSKPKPTAVPSRPVKPSKPDTVAAAPLRQPSSPTDDLAARLKRLAQLRQPEAPVPPSPRRQDGTGASNLAAASPEARPGLDATYGVKDFIRAQVERRWTPDRKAAAAGGWTVSIHIELGPDGRVSRADIVDDPRYAGDDGFRAFALSARNAVLLSSPLVVPPGAYDVARDIVVDFNTRPLSR
jgi:hypothetical protein